MTNLINTLYVTTPGAYLRKDHESLVVRIERRTALAVPIHHLAGVVCFGQVGVSHGLLHACGKAGVAVSFLSRTGRFLARVEGPRSASTALRRAQFRAADDAAGCARLARGIVIGKIANARSLLLRGAREAEEVEDRSALVDAAGALATRLDLLGRETPVLDELRGHEGEAARRYFEAFDRLLKREREAFRWEGRTRRPPLDPLNALLSFLYALVTHDADAALQSVGLDPGVGFLHAERAGRPSLALDLAEEFRSALADRLAVAAINLGQVKPGGFMSAETGAVSMDDSTRKAVIVAYQKRKQEPIVHPFTGEQTTIGLSVFIQARLLARAIRGDLDAYPPFTLR
ncbi:MAG TPA: type I-C CRISPR-associated endonuclease Cas1c [Anaeromyxobacter sp.]